MGQWSKFGASFGAPLRATSSGLALEADTPSLGLKLLDTPCRVTSPVSCSKQRTDTHSTRHTIQGCRKSVFNQELACNSAPNSDFRALLFIASAASNLQHGEERFLRNVHAADALHALLAFFLFFEEFAFARDVSAVALGDHVFANRADCFARDYAAADGGLDAALRTSGAELVCASGSRDRGRDRRIVRDGK